MPAKGMNGGQKMRNITNVIDEDHESWVNLMMAVESAKGDPGLQELLKERVPPEVLCAAGECCGYEDFKHRLENYQREALPHA